MKEIDEQINGTFEMMAHCVLGSIYSQPDANRNAVLGQIIIELGSKIEKNEFTLADFADTCGKLTAFARAARAQLEV